MTGWMKKVIKKAIFPEEPMIPFTEAPEGILAEYHTPYLEDGTSEHTLDVFRPKGACKLPVILDIHGGAFVMGDKSGNSAYACAFAQMGFVVFSINYRLAGNGVTVPDQVQDVAAAAAWITAHLEEYGGDADRVFLSGDSSGAVLAVMEALLSRSERLQGIFRTPALHPNIRGVVCNCGFFDFDSEMPVYAAMRHSVFPKGYHRQGTYQNMRFSQLPEMEHLAPVFLISGAEDPLEKMTRGFARLLLCRGIPHKTIYLPKGRGRKLGHCISLYHPEYAPCKMVLRSAANWMKAQI